MTAYLRLLAAPDHWISIPRSSLSRLAGLIGMSVDDLIAGHVDHGGAIDDRGNLWCRLADERRPLHP
jgi:hypothetical protein